MSKTRIIKVKNSSEFFQNWKDQRHNYLENGGRANVEDIKSDPDLIAAPSAEKSPELEAALEMINAGGLQKLTAVQQKVWQLSVVEGKSSRDVADALGFKSKTAVLEQLALIRKKLEPLAKKHL